MAKTNAELQKEIEKLIAEKAELEVINSGIKVALETENADLKNQVDLLQQSIDDLNSDGGVSVGFVEGVAVDTLTRNDIIKGLLPSLPLNIHNTEAHVGNLLNCADILLKKVNG